MTKDDPFGAPENGSRTILKPTPGGTRLPQPPTASARPQVSLGPVPSDELPSFAREGLNPLESAASSLLALIGRLRETVHHPDPDGLRKQLVQALATFDEKVRRAGVSTETALSARYVLCTVLDEVVLTTPWGNTSTWRTHSLLSTLHNDTAGGEKFYVLLKQAAQDPARNIDLLELMYICLALGFEGRYRVMQRGRDELDALRERLYHIIRNQRGEFERELSPQWQGIIDRRNPLMRYVPLWVVASVAAALLLLIYGGFSIALNRASDPVFLQLYSLKLDRNLLEARPVLPPLAPLAPPPKPRVSLQGLLEADIRDQLIDVQELAEETRIIVRGDGLFASGSARLSDDYLSLFDRLAHALGQVPGRILVTGHTDNIPIRTLRFPSNWHLSEERALAVSKVLAARLGDARGISAEGRADTEPLVPNDTPSNRARNRRVEVSFMMTASGP